LWISASRFKLLKALAALTRSQHQCFCLRASVSSRLVVVVVWLLHASF